MRTVAHLDLAASPLAPGSSPVRIQYREWGRGRPIVVLHGGWGHDLYSFEAAIERLAARYRVIAPDRSGYAGSTPIEDLPGDFHRRAVAETFAVLDRLGVDRAGIWGHSDGAVIAVLMALTAPERIAGVVLEAMHLWGAKPASRGFFERAAEGPASFGEAVSSALAREHGERWPQVVALHGRAWLRIADAGAPDLYDGGLPSLDVPALVVHGGNDPRTEPGELNAIRAALPTADWLVLPEAGHSPHSEPATAEAVTAAVNEFFDRVMNARTPGGG